MEKRTAAQVSKQIICSQRMIQKSMLRKKTNKWLMLANYNLVIILTMLSASRVAADIPARLGIPKIRVSLSSRAC